MRTLAKATLLAGSMLAGCAGAGSAAPTARLVVHGTGVEELDELEVRVVAVEARAPAAPFLGPFFRPEHPRVLASAVCDERGVATFELPPGSVEVRMVGDAFAYSYLACARPVRVELTPGGEHTVTLGLRPGIRAQLKVDGCTAESFTANGPIEDGDVAITYEVGGDGRTPCVPAGTYRVSAQLRRAPDSRLLETPPALFDLSAGSTSVVLAAPAW